MSRLPAFEERFAYVKAVLLRYFVGGQGPSLVLIHGLGGSAANWLALAASLAGRARVLVPELPGHGGSAPLPAAPNLDAYADRVASLAEREEMLPAFVVGHSLGGAVGLRLALRRPEAVSGLVLAASAGISSATRRARYALRILGLVRPSRVLARYRRSLSRSVWGRYFAFGHWGAADPRALSPEMAEAFLSGPALHSDTVSAAQALVADELLPHLDGVRCRCLVLWGAQDAQLPVDDGFELARQLRAPLRVIPDCGHLLIGERPDACLAAIDELLHRVR
jgi:pimeloyl-ACP methyl ester carboxylesterase